MKVKTGDVVIWLILEGRSEILPEDRKVLNPHREAVKYDNGKRFLNVSILMDKAIFTKKRQHILLSKFKELKPYKLTAEIAIYHPTSTPSIFVDIPARILNCLGNIGANVSIVSYLTS